MRVEPDSVSDTDVILEAMRRNEGFFYLASPYSRYPDGMEAAFQEVCKAAAWLTMQKVHVYCPIAATHSIAKYGGIDPARHDIWMPADEPLLRGSCGLIVCMMPGWQESVGVTEEIALARDLGLPVFYLPYEMDE